MFNKKYLNEYRNTVSQNNALKVTLISLIAIILIEGYFIVATMNTQRTIIIPSVKNKYVFEDKSANTEYLTQMAYFLTSLIENFTPHTIKGNYSQFLNFVTPSSFGKVQAELNADAVKYIDMDASSFFSPLSIDFYKNNTIAIKGRKKILIAGKVTSDTILKIKIKYIIKHGKFEVISYEEEKSK